MNRPLDRWLLFAAWATMIGIVAAILYQLGQVANQKTTCDAGAFAIGEAMYHTVDPWPTTVPPGVTVAAPGA